MELRLESGAILQLRQGDITKFDADAIANAANSGLRGGGGVDGAIHRVGGPAIMQELDAIRAKQGGCATGGAVATTGGSLAARYVFHAVGPVYQGGGQGEAKLLASAYRTCMALARERKVKSIAFPSISTGIYGYPLEEAAPIALKTVAEELGAKGNPVQEATFVLFDTSTLGAYEQALKSLSDEIE